MWTTTQVLYGPEHGCKIYEGQLMCVMCPNECRGIYLSYFCLQQTRPWFLTDFLPSRFVLVSNYNQFVPSLYMSEITPFQVLSPPCSLSPAPARQLLAILFITIHTPIHRCRVFSLPPFLFLPTATAGIFGAAFTGGVSGDPTSGARCAEKKKSSRCSK